MSFHQSTAHPSASRLPPDSPTNKLKHRFSPDIRFHQPYQRLLRRKAFLELIRRFIKEDQLLRLDNFALFDAVAKRGGCQQVTTRGRWEQVSLCLQFQKKFWGLQKYYQQVLGAVQSELIGLCGWYTSPLQGETLQLHLLPANNLTTSYYHLTPNEYLFAESHFFSLDEYFNLKTLVLTQGVDLTRIPLDYAEKFIVMKKWLLFSGQLRFGGPKEGKLLGIPQRSDVRVVIVGLSLASLLVADRISEFGISVLIVDKGKREQRMRDEFQLVENGVMLLEGGNSKGSYFRSLQQSSVLMGEVALPSNGMLVLDEDGKPYAEDRIRISEEHFFAIMEQLKGEVMSKKNLYEQVVTRMIRRKLDYERFLIRWHYDRYMTFNRIKGDATTVADLAAYQSKKFVKHIAQPHVVGVVHSLEKLLGRVRERKNVTILSQPLDNITQINDTWTIHTRSDTLTANYLLYADQEAIFRGVLDGNPRLPECGAEVLGESAGILQQLTVMRYINCLFRFREKLLLREPLKNQTCFSICCAHGFVYFFVLNSGTEIMAILKCYHTSNLNYYSEILAILESKCLVKNNRLVNEELYSFEYTFGVKDEKFTENLIRLKDRMFLLLPITTTNCPHRTPALLDMANYIAACMLDEIHPNYHNHDPALRAHFKSEDKGQPVRKRGAKEGSVSSIPNLPSVRSMSEEALKIKILTVVAYQSQEGGKLGTVEGQLPSVGALFQMQDDWFGIKHAVVRGHEQFIRNRVQSSPNLKETLTSLSLLSLHEPVLLYPGTYLVSLGSVYVKESEWYSCLLSSPPPPAFLFCLNNYISRHEFVSLSNTFATTIYFQTMLIIDGELYYCIVDEANPSVKYFHTNLTTLINGIIRRLEYLRNELVGENKNYANIKISRCKFEPQAPSELIPSLIEQSIREELKNMKDLNIDQLLEEKLLYTGKTIYRFLTYDKIPVLTPVTPATPQQIYNQVSIYIDWLCRLHDLRQVTLFQMFFGVLNEQYIACEIMRKFSPAPLNYFDLEQLDQPLCKEVQILISKHIPNDLYAFLTTPDERCVYFHRIFLHPTNRLGIQQYTYMREIQVKKNELTVKHYMIENSQVQFTDQQVMMVELIKRWTACYRPDEIIHHLQTMANREVEGELNLTPRIKAYFRMTKKRPPETLSPPNMPRFMDKCRDLTQGQKLEIFNLMKSRRIRWVDGEMVILAK